MIRFVITLEDTSRSDEKSHLNQTCVKIVKFAMNCNKTLFEVVD